jgi:hypothetical protein
MMKLLISTVLKVKRALWHSHSPSNMNLAATRENTYLKIKLADLDKIYQSIVGSNSSANNSKEISFSEILNTALPESPNVARFNELINNIQSNKSIESIGDYYLCISSSTSTLIAIIDAHWNDFTLETKVLFLFKLRSFRSKYLLWMKLFVNFVLDVLNPTSRTWKRAIAYYSLNSLSRRRVDREFASNYQSVFQSFRILQATSSKLFILDGKLYQKNKKNIGRYINNLNQNKLRILRNQYTFDNDPELLIYLQYKPGMFALLKDAYCEFVRYFNSQCITLETLPDFDKSNLQSLSIKIDTDRDVDSSLSKLNEFRDSYWFDLPWQLIGDIIIRFNYR